MAISALKVGLGIMAIAIAIYDGIGLLFLCRDYSTVQACHPSNKDAHAIWPTSVWTYVLFSMITATGAILSIISAPLGRSVEAGRKTIKRNASPRDHDETLIRRSKFGLVPARPDWLFLWIGSIMISMALVFAVIAFWGYWELFMARPWCTKNNAAFQELDLWHFGRVSFVLQIVASIILFMLGAAYWSAPFVFELRDVFTSGDDDVPA